MKALSCIAALTLVAGSACAQLGMPITHEFVLRVNSTQNISNILAEYGLIVLNSYAPRGLYLVAPDPTNAARDDEEVSRELGLDSRLALSEQNRQNYAEDGHTQSFFVSIVPVDFGTQPTFKLIGLEHAAPFDGHGVTIAILDTGVAPHFEYLSAIRPDGGNFIDDSSPTTDAATGRDSNHNGIFDELVGHGTFVAGLTTHVAPGAEILPVKVLDSDGVGSSFTVAAGIYYALDHGARVINLSLSSPFDSVAVREAVQTARAANIAIVAAVSNTGRSIPQYPAADPGVVAVAATDLLDRHLPTSDFGSYVMFSAPGADVVSTFPGNHYAVASGTSVSTALVSGAVARSISRAPLASITPLVQSMYDASVDINRLNFQYSFRVGRRLNIGISYKSAVPGPLP